MLSSAPNNLPSKRNGSELAEHAESDARKIKTLKKELTTIQQQSKDREVALEEELRKVREELRVSRGEVRRMQEQDYNSRKKAPTESHEIVSQQFFNVFYMTTDWARKYFKADLKSFHLDKHELFKRHLNEVLWNDSGWTKKQMLNVSHLVQAVVAEVLSKRILLLPFAGCASSFRHEQTLLYEAMLKQNKSQAHKWRAMTFAAYERCEMWPPSSTPSEPISLYRESYYKEVANEIESIVGSIARNHFPDSNHDERLQKLMEFIEAAGSLSIKLGKQAAELKAMDKSWFEESQRVFSCDDERMKGRFTEEDEESEEGFRVDIILRPGFLKCGNDEGENFERQAVWIPAILDLRELGDTTAESDVQENPPAVALEKDVTMTDALQAQPPLHPHDGQHVPFMELPYNEPVESGSYHHEQQREVQPSPEVQPPQKIESPAEVNPPPEVKSPQKIRSPPEVTEPKSQLSPNQHIPKEQAIYQDEPPTNTTRTEGVVPVTKDQKDSKKRSLSGAWSHVKKKVKESFTK